MLACDPPLPESELSELVGHLNIDDDLSAFIRGMRTYDVQPAQRNRSHENIVWTVGTFHHSLTHSLTPVLVTQTFPFSILFQTHRSSLLGAGLTKQWWMPTMAFCGC